jgi:sec-independent protein translocase protein TatA
MDIGPTELLIILVIVVILFGSGRIAKLGGELGHGLREFRKGLAGEDETPAQVTPAATTTSDNAPSSNTIAKS